MLAHRQVPSRLPGAGGAGEGPDRAVSTPSCSGRGSPSPRRVAGRTSWARGGQTLPYPSSPGAPAERWCCPGRSGWQGRPEPRFLVTFWPRII